MFRIISRARRIEARWFARSIGSAVATLLLSSPAFAQIGGDRVTSFLSKCPQLRPGPWHFWRRLPCHLRSGKHRPGASQRQAMGRRWRRAAPVIASATSPGFRGLSRDASTQTRCPRALRSSRFLGTRIGGLGICHRMGNCHAADWRPHTHSWIALIAGFLEGSWARANQKALVKMHSPMRFSLALMSLGFIPILALLWVAAPLAISATLLVFALGMVGIISTRNLVVHAPTQF